MNSGGVSGALPDGDAWSEGKSLASRLAMEVVIEFVIVVARASRCEVVAPRSSRSCDCN